MNEARSLAVGAALILGEVAVTLALAAAAVGVAVVVWGAPPSLGLGLAVRLAGLLGAAAGVAVIADTLRYRDPRTMLLSTSVTLRKMFARMPLELPAERTEPFSAVGPYRYTRNPLYLGVVLIVLGAGVFDASWLLLAWTLTLLGWYWFLLIPFEERELRALFGESYERYRHRVPKLFPYRRPYPGPEPEP